MRKEYAEMEHIYNKVAVFLFCTAFYIADNSNGVIPVLAAVILSAAYSYFDGKKVKMAFTAAFCAVCAFLPELTYFLPLAVYDAVFENWIWVLAAAAAGIHFQNLPIMTFVLATAFSGIAVLLKHHSRTMQKLKKQYTELHDSSREMAFRLEQSNKELLKNQDNEIMLATLNERNRIARDIHDNVGHILSSAILQVGAMIATANDPAQKENLAQLNKTLTGAMDSIRKSVHNLHDEALDLRGEVKKLIDGFTFCEAELDYDIQSNPDKKLKYCFISIIKEALANVMKHSNATRVTVKLHEHPALYQLIVQDNGTAAGKEPRSGIGLANIADRVASFNGNLNISSEKGFRIFVSIPKNTEGE